MKGISQSLATRNKISLEKKTDRTILHGKIKNYILQLKKSDFPTLTDCAIYSGISEKALLAYELRTDENSSVRIMLELIRDMQKSSLLHGGLNRSLDSKIVTLLLKATHGLKEEPTHLEQNNIFNISPDLLAEALEISRTKKITSK